jgi:hypothetical protein
MRGINCGSGIPIVVRVEREMEHFDSLTLIVWPLLPKLTAIFRSTLVDLDGNSATGSLRANLSEASVVCTMWTTAALARV